MSTKKISDDKTTFCVSREHNPPSMQVFSAGTYEHVFPACNKKTIFVVKSGDVV